MWGQSECVGWERGKRERLSGVRDSVGRERVHRVRVGLKECVGGESCECVCGVGEGRESGARVSVRKKDKD